MHPIHSTTPPRRARRVALAATAGLALFAAHAARATDGTLDATFGNPPNATRCRIPPNGQSPVCSTVSGAEGWYGAVATSGPAVYLGLNQVVSGTNVDFAIEKRNGATGTPNMAWNGTGLLWFS